MNCWRNRISFVSLGLIVQLIWRVRLVWSWHTLASLKWILLSPCTLSFIQVALSTMIVSIWTRCLLCVWKGQRLSGRHLATGESFARLTSEFRAGSSTLYAFDKKFLKWFHLTYWLSGFITCMDGVNCVWELVSFTSHWQYKGKEGFPTVVINVHSPFFHIDPMISRKTLLVSVKHLSNEIPVVYFSCTTRNARTTVNTSQSVHFLPLDLTTFSVVSFSPWLPILATISSRQCFMDLDGLNRRDHKIAILWNRDCGSP